MKWNIQILLPATKRLLEIAPNLSLSISPLLLRTHLCFPIRTHGPPGMNISGMVLGRQAVN